MDRFWLLGLLALAFVVVTLRYSLETPLFEGSDEPAHFAYALSLAHGPGLPVLQDNPQRLTSEAHQPPLYYALCALPVKRLACPRKTPNSSPPACC